MLLLGLGCGSRTGLDSPSGDAGQQHVAQPMGQEPIEDATASADSVGGDDASGDMVFADSADVRASAGCDPSSAPAVLVSDQKAVALVLDATRVYWANGPDLRSVDKRGGPVAILASGQAATGLGVDDSDIFWSNDGYGSVWQCPKLGGGNPRNLSFVGSVAAAIALDDTSVYWADSSGDFSGGVWRVPKTGGPSSMVTTTSSPASDVAVDSAFVYWTDVSGKSVSKVALAGGTTTTLGSSGIFTPDHLRVDATFAYWTAVYGSEGMVARVPKNGGDVTVLARGSAPAGLALDADYVYWTDSTEGALRKTPIGGGATVTIADNQPLAHAVAVDDSCVYWTTDWSSPGSGRILKGPK
jgi:hypothetical protein